MDERDAEARFFLGVDAGATKTLAVVVNADGEERGRGAAGSANLRTVGLEQTLAQVRQAVQAAVGAARASLPLTAAWFGVAGLHTGDDAEAVTAHLQMYAHEIRVSNDADLVLSGLAGKPGVALIAGTGSIALGRSADGRRVQVGGWGHVLGDEGSGYDIGRRGLQAAVRAADGRNAPTLLLELVLRHLRLATPNELVAQVYQHTSYEDEKASIAGLAPLVVHAAQSGDTTARRILRHAASEICLLAVTAIDALDAGKGPVSLAAGGGLLVHDPALRASVVARIRRRRRLGNVTVVAEPARSAARALSATHRSIVARSAHRRHQRLHHDAANAADAMTLEQQIGQLFAVGFFGTKASQGLLDLIQRDHVGSVILFSRNIRSREQTAALIATLQAAAREAGHPVPLLIMTDQENGLVRRLGQDSTILPGNMALGAVDDALAEQLVYEVAQATARELLAHGITMNLAPVVDINSNPANPVIGIRSFGERPERVARLGAAAVRGYQDGGVIATLKHFPGHGDTTLDSHVALPTIAAELERLERVELVPFRAGIEAGADAVMIAHVGLPALSGGDIVPATLAQPIVLGLLRERLGFPGLIVSDCLEMDAVARSVGAARGAVGALQAGIDLVLVSHRLDRQRASLAAVRAAVASGELSAERVREAAQRVVRLKQSRLVAQMTVPVALPADVLAAHCALSDRAYAQSVTVVRDDAGLLPLCLAPDEELLVLTCASRAISQAVDIPYTDEPLVAALRSHFPRARSLRLEPDDAEEALAEAAQAVQRADAVIVVTLNLHLDGEQTHRAQHVVAGGPRCLIGLAACDPYDIGALPEVATFIATYEYSPPALEAAAKILIGDAQAHGTLPITLRGSPAWNSTTARR